MEAQRHQQCRMLVAVGQDRAAVAIAAERLGREEAGRDEIADCTGDAALVAGAVALRGIRDQDEAVLLAEGLDRLVVAGLAEEIDGDQGAGRELVLLRRLQRGSQALRVDIVGRFVDCLLYTSRCV